MADKSKHFDLGEYGKDACLESVQLGAAVSSSHYGNTYKITGVNSDGQAIVAPVTGTDTPSYVCVRGSEGAQGDIVPMVVRGTVKVTLGDTIAAGAALAIKMAKIQTSTGSSESNVIGWSRVAAADTDTGLIYFQRS